MRLADCINRQVDARLSWRRSQHPDQLWFFYYERGFAGIMPVWGGYHRLFFLADDTGVPDRDPTLPEIQALKVLADLKSADGVVSGRALTQVAKALDIDSGEIKVLQNLFRTGVVPEVDTRASSRALVRLRSIPAEQRASALARVEDSLANLNTAKINAGNRDQALEAIVSGAQFGADPKRVAAVVTDWDGGLDGLARTYDLARKKMDLPELRGIASTDDKLERSFRMALREQRPNAPELKALPDSEWAKVEDKMVGCGLKGQ